MGRDRRQSSARQLRFHALIEPVGAHPEGAARLARDLIGNLVGVDIGTVRALRWFRASPTYPEYSADFFDGDHFVMKGASPLTARTLVAWIP